MAIEWNCQHCGDQIDDGWIDLHPRDYREAGRGEKIIGEHKWRVRDRKCVPQEEFNWYVTGYDIEIDRIRSWAHLTEWTAHILFSKCWGPYTNWMDLVAGQVRKAYADKDGGSDFQALAARGGDECGFFLLCSLLIEITEDVPDWVVPAGGGWDPSPRFCREAMLWEQDASRGLREAGVFA